MGLTLFLSFIAAVPSAHGQAFSDLYEFTSEADGDRPDGLALDAAGNLYGSTYYGGSGGNGILFKLDAAGKKTLLYRFKGLPDGSGPNGVVRDAAGNLYGTTSFGGSGCPGQHGCGTVFKVDANGKETILHRFAGHGDGTFPTVGVVIDASGNLYGTTYTGGALSTCNGAGCGTVFKVDASGKETVLYRFRGGTDGYSPYGGVVLDDWGQSLWHDTGRYRIQGGFSRQVLSDPYVERKRRMLSLHELVPGYSGQSLRNDHRVRRTRRWHRIQIGSIWQDDRRAQLLRWDRGGWSVGTSDRGQDGKHLRHDGVRRKSQWPVRRG